MSSSQVTLERFGGPEDLHPGSVETLPPPSSGEVRIRVLVTSAAFTDLMSSKGMNPDVTKTPPLVPGYDLVGRVDALGPDVSGFAIGDRVADLTTFAAYSEFTCLAADRPTMVPENVSDADALAMILSAVTPFQMRNRVARARSGQSILIHGAGGAVGTAALQPARNAGLTAYGTDVVTRHNLIRHCGGMPIDAEAPNLAAAISTAVGDEVNVTLNPLGGNSLARSRHALEPGGMLVAYGFTQEVLGQSGSILRDFVKLKLWDWLPNGLATAFYSIAAMRRRHPDRCKQDLAAHFAMFVDDQFEPAVANGMPLTAVRHTPGRVESGVEGLRKMTCNAVKICAKI